jgi:hypothetical protein
MEWRRRPTDHRSRQRRLARSALPQDAKHPAGMNFQIDTVEDRRSIAVADQIDAKAAHAKERLSCHIVPPSRLLRARSTQEPIKLIPNSVAKRKRPGIVGIHHPLMR